MTREGWRWCSPWWRLIQLKRSRCESSPSPHLHLLPYLCVHDHVHQLAPAAGHQRSEQANLDMLSVEPCMAELVTGGSCDVLSPKVHLARPTLLWVVILPPVHPALSHKDTPAFLSANKLAIAALVRFRLLVLNSDNLRFRHLPCKPQLGSPMVGTRFSLIFSQTDSNYHHLAVLQELGVVRCDHVWEIFIPLCIFFYLQIALLQPPVRKEEELFLLGWPGQAQVRLDQSLHLHHEVQEPDGGKHHAVCPRHQEPAGHSSTSPPCPGWCSPFSPPSPGWHARSWGMLQDLCRSGMLQDLCNKNISRDSRSRAVYQVLHSRDSKSSAEAEEAPHRTESS